MAAGLARKDKAKRVKGRRAEVALLAGMVEETWRKR